MEGHPGRTFGWNTRKRERVRCSSLVDWPVYPRLSRDYVARPSAAQCRDAESGNFPG
jgi:hypothetical protein